MSARDRWNASRFSPGDAHGFYESWFQRANHPTRPLAFWIRYTVFSPRGRPEDARGELWAIWFDGETGRIDAVKESLPLSACDFPAAGLHVRIGSSMLEQGAVTGAAASTTTVVEWDLRYSGDEAPLLLLPEWAYRRRLPKAKALVGTPNADYAGTITVNGETIAVDGWRGSQNHNWGSQHTDRYAWGQVAGFDEAPDAFLECATAQIRLGPFWSPRLTFVVFREQGFELALNGLAQAVRARGEVDFFSWTIDARGPQGSITGRIHAPQGAFIGLRYANPPGGVKTCLNTKLAEAEFTMRQPGRPARTLSTKHRAAFEILTDREDHGVAIAF